MRIRNIDDYTKKTLEFDQMLRRYSVTKRGRRTMTSTTFHEVIDRRRGKLYSSNAAARIAFATETANTLTKIVDPSPVRPAFHVTICPDLGLQRASTLGSNSLSDPGRSGLAQTVQAIRSFTEGVLAGTSFFGVVEVAFFTAHPTSMTIGPVFSVHAHAIVWDVDAAQLRETEAAINSRHQSLIPGRPVAFVQPIVRGSRVASVALYGLKPPFDEYRAWKKAQDPVEEVWQQRTRPLRPGQATLVAGALAGLQMSDLSFSAGAAAGITRTIAEAARSRLKRDEAWEAKRIGALLS